MSTQLPDEPSELDVEQQFGSDIPMELARAVEGPRAVDEHTRLLDLMRLCGGRGTKRYSPEGERLVVTGAELERFAAAVLSNVPTASRGAFRWNPYTGMPRMPEDIASDPQGLLIVPPGGALLAADRIEPSPGNQPREWTVDEAVQSLEDFNKAEAIYPGHVGPIGRVLSGLKLAMAASPPSASKASVDGIFNVMNTEPYVGKFYQASFTTREKAQAFIDSAPKSLQAPLSITEHALDTATTEGWESLV